MALPLLVLAVVAVLALGYTLYGRFVARQLAVDDARVTPAVAQADGIDFVPTRPFYLLGQHFSAIAAAGPIAGPILACQAYGWAPCVLWIALGVVFIGAVHDLAALVASIRHKARSVAEVVKENMGPRAWRALLVFIWLALVYVIVAFTDITAATLTDPRGDLPPGATFSAGGAVAFAAVTYLALAVLMGVVQRLWNPPLLLLTLLFVPATLGAVWVGTEVSTLLVLSHATWAVLILAYCLVASLVPVWLLLQPRGYLGGFLLYLALAVGTLGILFGGFDIQAPAFKSGVSLVGLEGALLPFLFVTIACGACSGFHGLVCSGTTAKQIAKESHCHPVGYGAMLLEGLVALIALATIMIASPAPGTPPGRIYAEGIARCLTVFTGEGALVFAATFGAMAFSTFVFDTLDVATRLGRYLVQELFGWVGRGGALAGTLLTAGVPPVCLLAAGKDGYKTFWVLFGTSNQLLAALTLLGITVWLRKQGRRCWFVVLPMVFLFVITLWSLLCQGLLFWGRRIAADGSHNPVMWINFAVTLVLAGLALFLLWEARRALRGSAQSAETATVGSS